MKVLFDAFWVEHGPPSNKLVLHEQMAAWRAMFPSDEILAAVPWGSKADSLPDSVRVAKTFMPLHPFVNAIEIPLIAARHNVDASICQNFSSPYGVTATFLHDVLFQSNPEWFTPVERLYLSVVPTMAKTSSLLWTSSLSESSRIAQYNPKLQRANAVGLAVPSQLKHAVPEDPGLHLISDSFVLSVGRLNVRKNLRRTIVGALASGLISPARPLVVVGEQNGSFDREDLAFGEAIADGTVILAGHQPIGALRWLYEHCCFFCFTSMGEGFGLPPVEAASFGKISVVADLPVMRENLGEYAVYVDPTDVGSIAAGMKRAFRISRLSSVEFEGSNLDSWSKIVVRMREQLIGIIG